MSRLISLLAALVCVAAQICNSRDLVKGGGIFFPAFSHGDAMATHEDGTKVITCKLNATDATEQYEFGCVSAEYDPSPLWVLYLLLLLWTFMGVGIISDVFMGAIETITSKSKLVEYEDDVTGEIKQVEVFAWNATVANLSLMALGSSAPEILLAVIEVLGAQFYSGDLGPSTIVGSAAFNMLGIIGVCMMCIPKKNGTTETKGYRKIDEVGVFAVTAFSSVFAYIWVLIVLEYNSPNVVDLPEAIATLLFTPALVIIAYCADKGYFSFKKDRSLEEAEAKVLEIQSQALQDGVIRFDNIREADALLKDSNFKPKNMSPEQLADVILAKKLQATKVSRAARRQDATRGMTGRKKKIPTVNHDIEDPTDESKTTGCEIESEEGILGFESTKYQVLESKEKIDLTVMRQGGIGTITVDYETIEKSAKADEDFKYTKGTLTFHEGETQKTISVVICQDDEQEDDEFFDVVLTNLQPPTKGSHLCIPMALQKATVKIIDDDMPGTIRFATTYNSELPAYSEADEDDLKKPLKPSKSKTKKNKKSKKKNAVAPAPFSSTGDSETDKLPVIRKSATSVKIAKSMTGKVIEEGFACEYHIPESEGKVMIKVIRENGSAGRVKVNYSTRDVTAMAPADYTPVENGELWFETGECEKIISIIIIDDENFEKDEQFQVRLTEAEGCELGDLTTAVVTILNDDEMGALGAKVANLLKLNLDQYAIGGRNWKGQFQEAVEWPSNGGCMDKFLHILSLPWKLLFATVPPTTFCGGWVTFVLAIGLIGLVTAAIGDLANLLGCTLGLKSSVTAITFVALGTSLPDTFASKAAAIGDSNADNSIGNVTGSNSVNVFLGLGLPWTIAAVYWAINGEDNYAVWEAKLLDHPMGAAVINDYPGGAFFVPAGELSFSVLVFSLCAVTCLIVLVIRRIVLGYELGGSYSTPCGIFFFFLWVLYIVLSSLKAYAYF